ncbi:hypothetical protein AAHE18_03G233100 [Arachis hypogaea]
MLLYTIPTLISKLKKKVHHHWEYVEYSNKIPYRRQVYKNISHQNSSSIVNKMEVKEGRNTCVAVQASQTAVSPIDNSKVSPKSLKFCSVFFCSGTRNECDLILMEELPTSNIIKALVEKGKLFGV